MGIKTGNFDPVYSGRVTCRFLPLMQRCLSRNAPSRLYLYHQTSIYTLYILAEMSQRKQEKDYTSEVTALVPEVESLAKVSSLIQLLRK